MVLRSLTVLLLTFLTSILSAQPVDCEDLIPELIDDATVCQGAPIQLLRNPLIDPRDVDYFLLSGRDTIRRGRNPNFSINLDQDTTLILLTRSDDGVCEDRQTVSLTVIPGLFDIPQDTIFSCLGTDSITLSVATDSFLRDATISWSPNRFSAGTPRGSSFRVLPVADITYFARATVNGCPRVDSVAVRLDSLPQNLGMTLDPEKDPYCQGDTFFVRSPVFDAGDFPLVTHEWIDAPGLQSPRELYNGVFAAQDTAELTRVTTNGACVDTTSILVNVIIPPQVSFDPVDPVVCPGEPLQITATFVTGSGTLSWEDPNNTLSCTDCLDPVATVQTDTEYSITVESGDSECTSDLSYSIRIQPDAVPILTDATLLCPGDSRQLIVGGVAAGNTYRITGGGVDITDVNQLVTPTETTTYTVETTGSCGTNTQEITLVVLDDYTVEATGPTTVCAGESLTLDAAVSPEVSVEPLSGRCPTASVAAVSRSLSTVPSRAPIWSPLMMN